ncbi:MAG: cardiolipin synthase [Bacteroides sp.]|nr:cardiolipin synthase [Bacteroides sp.]MBD5307361.1 cardiolipin synthase [Bacteroides sp.]
MDVSLWLALWVVYYVIAAGCIVVVLSENRNPIRALSWTIALLSLPGIGLIFYLFFGRSLKGISMISRRNKRRLMHDSRQRTSSEAYSALNPDEQQLARLAHNICRAPLTVNNSIRIYTEGDKKFRDLRHDLRAARKSIMVQYYIFSDDALGSEIADILIDKARAGLQVMVIYDHVGSFSASRHFFRRMKEAGVKVHPFFRVTFPQLANRINWRNHRKIVIIDDAIGYIGGMNIADRYVQGLPDGREWRDTHFRVEGGIIRSLFYSFSIDWNFLKPNEAGSTYRFDPPAQEKSGNVGMQLITSGPTDRWESLSLCFMKAISTARKRIYIQTPYFLPTDSLQHALEAAALAKLDVRIMIPRRSDSRLLKLASYSYITQSLRAGIKVYLYEPGMLHAKAMIIDNSFVTAGSTNFDFRSFENNFESNLLIYDEAVNTHMRDIFFRDINDCTKLTLKEWMKRPVLQRFYESLLRLISPIL